MSLSGEEDVTFVPRPGCGCVARGVSEGHSGQRVRVVPSRRTGRGQPRRTVTLSRNLCLEKWSFCHFPYQCLVAPTWKHFFLSQRKRERRMALAQPEDFIYREAAGNLGRRTGHSRGA